MLFIVKATLAGEHRRFTLANVDRTDIPLVAAKLTYEILHSKLSALFGQPKLSIHLEDQTGTKKLIQKDSDVLAAVIYVSELVPPTASMTVLKLTVQPWQAPPVVMVEPPQDDPPCYTTSDCSSLVNREQPPKGSCKAPSVKKEGACAKKKEGTCAKKTDSACVKKTDSTCAKKTECTCTKRTDCERDSCKTDTCSRHVCKKHVCRTDTTCKKHVCQTDACKKDVCKTDTCKKNNCKKDTDEQTKSCEEVIHSDVYCDICLCIIKGVRYKCKVCDNYDLCQDCLPLAPELHIHDHDFKSIEKPIRYRNVSSSARSKCSGSSKSPSSSSSSSPPLNQAPKNLMHSASCDICTVNICGTRYKCFTCPDYDVCEECLHLVDIHHHGHNFAPIMYPGQVIVHIDSTPHPDVICDECENLIYGVRYKCGNCTDFDLCGNCEASPTPVHDPDHLFIKIRKPLNHSSAVKTPLLPIMYKKGWEKTICSHPQSSNEVCPVGLWAALNAAAPVVEAPSARITANEQYEARTIAPPQPEEAPRAPTVAESVASLTASTSSVTLASSAQSAKFSAEFVKDINLHDGTVIQAGSQFLKIWEMSNSGPSEWPKETVLQYVGGDRMFTDTDVDVKTPFFEIPMAAVGESVCVTADLKAPASPGRYISYWRLVAPTGESFGQRVWCDILVEECSDSGSDSISSSAMIFPTVDYQESNNGESASRPSNTNTLTETDASRTALSVASAYTVGGTTTASLTEDQLSTTSGRFTTRSEMSSVYGRDESSDDQTETESRFFSEEEGFVVVIDSDDDDSLA